MLGLTEEERYMSDPAAEPASLRAEQVAQTRAALVAAGRRLFGENGFRATSVEDLARELPARYITTSPPRQRFSRRCSFRRTPT
jgi:hypothetical protein